MQRRFEMYRIRDGVPEARVAELESILRGCGRFIPQLRHSIAARNLSQAPVHLIWEHAYDSAESYQAYMRHPYHICVLDRYLLPDVPDRLIEYDGLGLGLVGYETDLPHYYRDSGLRRLVMLRVAADASRDGLAALEELLRRAPGQAPGPSLSIVAPNEMGAEWFPGLWSHVWEQAFDDEAQLRAYLEGPSPAARAEREGWREGAAALVEASVDVHYRIHPPLDPGPR